MDFSEALKRITDTMSNENADPRAIEEIMAAKESSHKTMLSMSIEDKMQRYYREGKVVYGTTEDELIEALNIAKRQVGVDILGEFLRKYKQFEMTDWYLTKKQLHTGDDAIVLLGSMTARGDIKKYTEADAPFGLLAYVYNISNPWFSEAGSVQLKWGEDSYIPRKLGE